MDRPISELEYVHKTFEDNRLTQQIYILNNMLTNKEMGNPFYHQFVLETGISLFFYVGMVGIVAIL